MSSSIDDYPELNPFLLEDQWKAYLKRARITEEEMGEIQRSETKKAFYAGCSQMLIMMRDDIGSMPEAEAVVKFDSLYDQLNIFWDEEQERYNKDQRHSQRN